MSSLEYRSPLRTAESGRRRGLQARRYLRPQTDGFTLIEILVVVVILAVVSVAVMLSTDAIGGARQLAQEADRVHALLGYACEQAELTGREIGLSMNRKGYRFSRLDHSDWVPITNDELRERKWLAGTDVQLSRDGHSVRVIDDFPDKPQLVCFSSGELTAFRLDLRLSDLAQGWRLDGAPDGTLKLVAADARGR